MLGGWCEARQGGIAEVNEGGGDSVSIEDQSRDVARASNSCLDCLLA